MRHNVAHDCYAVKDILGRRGDDGRGERFFKLGHEILHTKQQDLLELVRVRIQVFDEH